MNTAFQLHGRTLKDVFFSEILFSPFHGAGNVSVILPMGGALGKGNKTRVFESLLYSSPLWAQFLMESDFGPHGQLKSASFDDGPSLGS